MCLFVLLTTHKYYLVDTLGISPLPATDQCPVYYTHFIFLLIMILYFLVPRNNRDLHVIY